MLKVALITKGSTRATHRDFRPLGWWSYQVPEFTWEHLRVPQGMSLDVGQLAGRMGFDLFVQEDWSGVVRYTNKTVPIVFMSYDDTLTKVHLEGRVRVSLRADLCLVDHGPLKPFESGDRPVRRMAHAVNNHLFKPVPGKVVDVVFHCSSGRVGATERSDMRKFLCVECKRMGLTYRSGVVPVEEYAKSMAEARVVVNLPRTQTNRPHRVFDSMACGACLLTAPIPTVDGDGLVAGVHYASWDGEGVKTLSGWLEALIHGGQWETYAAKGHAHVMENHTWATRAKQFRAILGEEFGL